MGVRDLVTRWAVRRPHVLVVEVPGGLAARVSVEAELDRRGWVRSTSPADADVLVVAGPTWHGLDDEVSRTWSQLPGPRSRRDVTTAYDVADALSAAAAELADDTAQRRDAVERDADGASHDLDAEDASDMAPSGLPLAGGAEDRDGLEMDVLVHPLGPLLPDHPAGLVVTTTLHGDVVAEVALSRTTVPADVADRGVPTPAVEALDAAATVLRLVGHERRSRAVRRARDGEPTPDDLRRVRAQLEASRLLRPALGPARAPLLDLLDRVAAGERAEPLEDDELVATLRGHDLGDVRLLLAALAPRIRPRAVSRA